MKKQAWLISRKSSLGKMRIWRRHFLASAGRVSVLDISIIPNSMQVGFSNGRFQNIEWIPVVDFGDDGIEKMETRAQVELIVIS